MEYIYGSILKSLWFGFEHRDRKRGMAVGAIAICALILFIPIMAPYMLIKTALR